MKAQKHTKQYFTKGGKMMTVVNCLQRAGIRHRKRTLILGGVAPTGRYASVKFLLRELTGDWSWSNSAC